MDLRRSIVAILKCMITPREEIWKEKNREEKSSITTHGSSDGEGGEVNGPWLQYTVWVHQKWGHTCTSKIGEFYDPDSSSKFSNTSSRRSSGYEQSSFWKVLEVWQCRTGGLSVCVWVCLEKFSERRFRVQSFAAAWWWLVVQERNWHKKQLYPASVVSIA